MSKIDTDQVEGIGDLTALSTTNKNNLVAAINEVNGNIPTIPTNYITTNTNQAGLIGNKTTSGIWEYTNPNGLHVSAGLGRVKLGRQSSDGDVSVGSSGIGSPPTGTTQDYGFYLAYNAFRDSDGYWKHSRQVNVIANIFKGGHHTGGFSWGYSPNVGAGNVDFTELMKLSNIGELKINSTSANVLKIERTNSTNTTIEYINSGISIFAGSTNGTSWAVGGTADLNNISTRWFWVDNTGLATAKAGFSKTGATNNDVLLGSGGHRPVSDFALASSIITPNNGLLTITTSADLTGGGTFSADQATASNISVGLSSSTLANIALGVKANNWGDHAGLYPLLSGAYANPTWITSLDWSKITNKPNIPPQLVYTGSNGINVTGTVISPTYGTTANTIAQGNDARINNGQTAYSWGDYSKWGLGAGVINNAVVTSDLFTVTGTGLFRYANNALNIPDSSNGSFITIMRNSSYVSRLAFSDSGKIFYTYGNTNVWQEFWTNANFNPAQYVLQSTLNTQLANYVPINGVTTINNTKTFTSSPVVPNGTLNGHAVNLGQLNTILNAYALASAVPTNNNQLTNGAGYITASALGGYVQQSSLNTQLANYVTLGSVQTITATKTFTVSPIVPNGTLSGHTVNLGQMQAYVASQIPGNSGIERIQTDNSTNPGPAEQPTLYFNFHEYWGFPQAFADETQPGNATAKANNGQLDFFASYDSVHTIVEYGGTADVDMKGCHIVNVLLMSNGGDVHLPDGVYVGDQINITTLPNQQINIYTNNLITTMGNEVWTFANLVWDCEHTAWVMTGFGTP